MFEIIREETGMLRVYIWGAGYYARQVIEEIDNTKVKILGILDYDERKQESRMFYPIPIISPSYIVGKDFDYIIISVKNYESVENECRKLRIEEKKVITYWKEEPDDYVFKKRAKRVEGLIQENKMLQYRLDSAPYEWGVKRTPKITGGAGLLKKIIKDRSSLCRFGDGEFEIIRGNERPWFQKLNQSLGRRLNEILITEDERINIAIAQDFTGLERYKEDVADIIREYMFEDTRSCILRLLDENRVYYDAYVSRPYIIYKDKRNADEIFPLFKDVWRDRDVVIVEGEYSRIGVGNDLMECACSVSRIICPSRNAWDKYETILNKVLEIVPKKALVCVSLGPSATVLAYDLAKEGYQALDIGQIDNEYEWYLTGAQKREKIPGKMVAELLVEQDFELKDEAVYRNQIIAKIV